jgi:hypothetical protein
MEQPMTPGLEAAVRDQVIDRATAERLQPYLTGAVAAADTADPDDEKLRLVTGFNDIFVTIGLLLFLGALGFLTFSFTIIAAAAWALAEFFTRKRRMALPSIVLLIAFVGGVFLTVGSSFSPSFWVGSDTLESPALIIGAIAAAIAAAVHWWRFQVPITVAAGVAALVAIVLALSRIFAPGLLTDHPLAVFLPAGVAVFALAMWIDSADLKRQTRRTDVAFWLHLLAAPLIVHPLLMAVMNDEATVGAASKVIVAFLLLAVVALVVDRRAILVSSLVYLAYAAGALIEAAGAQSSSFAISTLTVGAVVLLLSAAWKPLRRAVMALLPQSLRSRLPAVA